MPSADRLPPQPGWEPVRFDRRWTRRGARSYTGLVTEREGDAASESAGADRPAVHAVAGRRDRDAAGRARQARPRDRLGRPLPYGSPGVLPVSEEPLPPAETVAAARLLLAAGRPFSAHEVFEARWKACPPEERDLWQGLAQLCVAITHAERGNSTGAGRLLGRARGRLMNYVAGGGPSYGLDLPDLLSRPELLSGPEVLSGVEPGAGKELVGLTF